MYFVRVEDGIGKSMIKIDHTSRLRKASGQVVSTGPLVSFLYELMRDHVPPGVVEGIMKQTETDEPNYETIFTNGWLARYAEDVAARLRGK
jgi:hypothetical protein